jgi:predicted transposase YbfD/YdcC
MVIGSVSSHAIAMRCSMLNCSPVPAATMVPAIPDVTTWVVFTGMPVLPAMPMTTAETTSADPPCAGVMWIFPKVDWLFSDRRYADEPRFPHLAMIGMVETRVERNGAIARERRYYLSSATLDAKSFAAAVRAHWGVENRLHWVLDVIFHDDLTRLRSLNGPQNMAVVKHMAMNLVRNPKDKHSLKVRRKFANLNPDYLETLIRQNAPLT